MNSGEDAVSTDTDRDEMVRLALETEIRDLRQRLAVRERSLAELNRRVVQLEKGGSGVADISVLIVRNQELDSKVRALEAELTRVHQTKLFRWTRPARSIYRMVRQAGVQ